MVSNFDCGTEVGSFLVCKVVDMLVEGPEEVEVVEEEGRIAVGVMLCRDLTPELVLIGTLLTRGGASD